MIGWDQWYFHSNFKYLRVKITVSLYSILPGDTKTKKHGLCGQFGIDNGSWYFKISQISLAASQLTVFWWILVFTQNTPRKHAVPNTNLDSSKYCQANRSKKFSGFFDCASAILIWIQLQPTLSTFSATSCKCLFLSLFHLFFHGWYSNNFRFTWIECLLL